MKKLLVLLAFAGVMAACGGEKKQAEEAQDVQEKSLAVQVYEAMKSGDPDYIYLMEKIYLLPAAEQQAALEELGRLSEADCGPEAG